MATLEALKRRMLMLGGDQEQEQEQPQAMSTQGIQQSSLSGSTPSYRMAGGNPGDSGYQAQTVKFGEVQAPNYQGVNDFDFNRQYEDQRNSLSRSLAEAQSQYDMSNQTDNENYLRTTRDIEQGAQKKFDLESERLANNGILRSGVAVGAQGAIGQEAQSMLDRINQQRTQGMTDRESQFSGYQQQINQQLAALQAEHTRRQQLIEQERARQAAEAQAAQDAAQRSYAAMPGIQPNGNIGQPQQNNEQTFTSFTDPSGNGMFLGRPMTQAQIQAEFANGNPLGPGYQLGNQSVPTGEMTHQQAIQNPAVAAFLESLFRAGR